MGWLSSRYPLYYQPLFRLCVADRGGTACRSGPRNILLSVCSFSAYGLHLHPPTSYLELRGHRYRQKSQEEHHHNSHTLHIQNAPPPSLCLDVAGSGEPVQSFCVQLVHQGVCWLYLRGLSHDLFCKGIEDLRFRSSCDYGTRLSKVAL